MSEVLAMPPAVRARLAVLVAEVLPSLDPVPPRLRRIADFAPARRAQLGGEQILAELGGDASLRSRVAPLVAERLAPDGDAEEPDGPADRAALVWLRREPGWEEAWEAATDRLVARAEREAASREGQEVLRAQEAAERAETALRDLRGERKRQVDELRAEVTTLRRRLGETRARERETRRESETTALGLETARRELADTAAAADAEGRRLRGRVAELEAVNATLRRAGREDRDEASLRVRVLLDSVVEAATGLRRELVLPVVEGAPGDTVERRVAERAAAGPTTGPTVGRDGPVALDQYLAAPRARLLVDGYNVSKTAWPQASLEEQRTRLLRALAPVVARTGAETTVVFDGAAAQARPSIAAPRGVRVLFSPYGVIADEVIGELVEAEPGGRTVVVVSSDREVARHAVRHGARAVAAATLVAVLA